MAHIQKVKLFNGELRYAVVSEFKSVTQDVEGNVVTKVENLPVDYKVGKQTFPAVFSYDEEGLEKAKEIQKLYNKKR